MLDVEKERYLELQTKIRDFGQGGFMKLSKAEKEEYAQLKEMDGNDKEPMLPKTYVINMLDSLFKVITDGSHRAVLLKWKREVQAYE